MAILDRGSDRPEKVVSKQVLMSEKVGEHLQAEESASTNNALKWKACSGKFKANLTGGELAMLGMLVGEVGEVARSQSM